MHAINQQASEPEQEVSDTAFSQTMMLEVFSQTERRPEWDDSAHITHYPQPQCCVLLYILCMK